MIEDLNLGRMSVTNNIENVVEEICIKEMISPAEVNIIYKDSDGHWDGFIFSTNEFVPLQEDAWLQAAVKLINLDYK